MFSRVKVFLLALLVLALAGTARAATIFPLGTYTYAASAGTDTWPSTITFTSPSSMVMTDWDSQYQGTIDVTIEMTATTFSMNQGYGLQIFFQPLAVEQTWDFIADDGSSGTATVVKIWDSFTVQAGTFNNVYEVEYQSIGTGGIHMQETMYWKPGVGLLQADDYMYPHHHQLASYAAPVPLPPGLLLFGTGLAGLAVWRRFRQG
ncbi:MAG: hypothetical protein WHT07_09525 [Desulfobaccales bacterium]